MRREVLREARVTESKERDRMLRERLENVTPPSRLPTTHCHRTPEPLSAAWPLDYSCAGPGRAVRAALAPADGRGDDPGGEHDGCGAHAPVRAGVHTRSRREGAPKGLREARGWQGRPAVWKRRRAYRKISNNTQMVCPDCHPLGHSPTSDNKGVRVTIRAPVRDA
eukprot:7091524-Pyramimonas_sp.AAC.1